MLNIFPLCSHPVKMRIRARAICELRKMSKIPKIKRQKSYHICISFCECIKHVKCIKPSYLYEVEAKAMSCLRSMCVQRLSKLFRMHENTTKMHNSCSLVSLQSMCACAKTVSCLRSVYVCVSYMSCNACAKTLLLLCVCASFNAKGVALLLLRFSTVYKLNAWVKHCYCYVDEIVQLF
jgi:hypothetical protein